MVFSSIEFLFFFLPIVVGIYYLIRRYRKLSNFFLAMVSLLFYAWGEPKYVLIMLASIGMNWLCARLVVCRQRAGKTGKGFLAAGVTMNLLILGVFKYLVFLTENVNRAFSLNLPVPQIALPIGISFFTFQAISYIVDIYRAKKGKADTLLGVCLYISFFPQLIAGPIVRYDTIADEILNRKETLDDFTEGMRRFMVGFCKKVLLANNLGLLVDTAFKLESTQLSVVGSWIAACAYLMQVYYDFGGYSDMAIGLGRMFGFHFLENFRMPFLSKSVAEFWRRWHISLGSWFQDYLYFPLGGSRVKTKARLLFNMFMVWSLTGLWHGAAWTYFLWGCGFFVMLAFERLTGVGKWMEKHPIGHFYAMFVIVTVTVMIRSDSLNTAWIFYGSMFGVNGAPFWNDITGIFLREYGVFFIAAVVCGLPTMKLVRKIRIPENFWQIASAAAILALTLFSVSSVAAGGYNPFIYFNF